MNLERFGWIIDAARKACDLPPGKFDMSSWKCGTRACVVGWACDDPRVREAGLHLVPSPSAGFGPEPCYGVYDSLEAVAEFLDIRVKDAHDLFIAGSHVPAKQVLEYLEAYYKENSCLPSQQP